MALEDEIRLKAYELWERAGYTGDPEDHWLKAERELLEPRADRLDATADEASPAAAVDAAEGNPRAAKS